MRTMLKRVFIILGVMTIIGVQIASAQGNDSCQTGVLLSFARTASACATTALDEACFGSGQISGITFDGENAFTQPGEQFSVMNLQNIITTSSDETWSVATISLRASLDRSVRPAITFLVFGNTQLTNGVPPMPEITVTTSGSANLRIDPQENSAILAQVGVNTTLIANGRTADQAWLRVFIPNMNAIGWVSRQALSNADLTPLVTIDGTPYLHPFQVLNFSADPNTPACDSTPPSGMIIQTPDVTTLITLRFQPDTTLQLSGTAFIQQEIQGGLTIQVVDGVATLQSANADDPVLVPAGARASFNIQTNASSATSITAAEPYTLEQVRTLPINNLPFRLRALPEPLTSAGIAAFIADSQRAQNPPTPAPATPDTTCRRVVTSDSDLRAGAGTFYEIVGSIRRDTLVRPIIRATDPDGVDWWQVEGNRWVRASVVAETGICRPVPVVNNAPAPTTNTLILETCYPTNGPLRPGQQVTLEFTPPSWETRAQAENAPQIDPGRIRVGSTRLQVRAGDVQQLTASAYVRTFRATWAAEVGNQRITGFRLGYTVICDLTIAAGG